MIARSKLSYKSNRITVYITLNTAAQQKRSTARSTTKDPRDAAQITLALTANPCHVQYRCQCTERASPRDQLSTRHPNKGKSPLFHPVTLTSSITLSHGVHKLQSNQQCLWQLYMFVVKHMARDILHAHRTCMGTASCVLIHGNGQQTSPRVATTVFKYY